MFSSVAPVAAVTETSAPEPSATAQPCGSAEASSATVHALPTGSPPTMARWPPRSVSVAWAAPSSVVANASVRVSTTLPESMSTTWQGSSPSAGAAAPSAPAIVTLNVNVALAGVVPSASVPLTLFSMTSWPAST